MDLSQLMMSRIDVMLSEVGPGMKVLLMDADTTTSVRSAKLVDHGSSDLVFIV
jgi:hypothetical protein